MKRPCAAAMIDEASNIGTEDTVLELGVHGVGGSAIDTAETAMER